MSTRDIEEHLRDIYGVDASPALISRITDKIMPQLVEWQSRPLFDLKKLLLHILAYSCLLALSLPFVNDMLFSDRL